MTQHIIHSVEIDNGEGITLPGYELYHAKSLIGNVVSFYLPNEEVILRDAIWEIKKSASRIAGIIKNLEDLSNERANRKSNTPNTEKNR